MFSASQSKVRPSIFGNRGMALFCSVEWIKQALISETSCCSLHSQAIQTPVCNSSYMNSEKLLDICGKLFCKLLTDSLLHSRE